MNIEVVAERRGLWIEFILLGDGKMFEEEIASRREKILNKADNKQEVDEMREIIKQYQCDKRLAAGVY